MRTDVPRQLPHGAAFIVYEFALFFGGLKRERQTFDRAAAAAGSTLMALAAIALVVPALFHSVAENAVRGARITLEQETILERSLSLEIAIVLFLAYVLSLVFSLRTWVSQLRSLRMISG